MALQHFRSLDGISLVSTAQRALALIVPAGSQLVAPEALGLRIAEHSYVAIERQPLVLPVGLLAEAQQRHPGNCPCMDCEERRYKLAHPYCPHGYAWDEFCEKCMIERQEYMAWATATGREPF